MSSHFIILLVIANLYGYQCVDGASCTTATTCQITDYTLSTCTSNVCDCINSSYTAIRTGCALKLDKPVISAMTGRSNQVVKGQSFTLTCNLVDAATFEWYQGTTNLGTNTQTYTKTANAAADVGSFTCKGTTADTLLTSESSAEFKVEMLGTGGLTTSSIQPTVVVPTATIVSGTDLTSLGCNNIPMGSATAISYTVDGAAATKPVTITGTNAGKSVTCAIANGADYTFSSGTSAAGKLPTLITNIQTVAVTFGGQTITEIDKGSSSTSLTLTCTFTPGSDYLGTSPTITYTWLKDGSAIGSETGSTYTVLGSGTYSCTAQLNSLTAVSSGNKVTVTFISDGLRTSSSQPIKGGRVILTCGDARSDGAAYQWSKDSVEIDRQFDRRLQIDNFDTGDDGTYACSILLNSVILDTYNRRLTTQTTIATPSVSVGGACGARLAEKGDYWLGCSTSSETIGMTYEWTAKGVVSTTVTGKYYSLAAVSTSHNGDYTCKARFGAYTSSVSSTKTVEVTDPGMVCNHDNTCISASTGYSGKCDLNDRCLCADGYSQKGEVCSDGILAAVSSTVIIAVAYLVSRII